MPALVTEPQQRRAWISAIESPTFRNTLVSWFRLSRRSSRDDSLFREYAPRFWDCSGFMIGLMFLIANALRWQGDSILESAFLLGLWGVIADWLPAFKSGEFSDERKWHLSRLPVPVLGKVQLRPSRARLAFLFAGGVV